MGLQQAAAQAARGFTITEIGTALVGILVVVGIIDRHLRVRKDRSAEPEAAEIEAAKEAGRKEAAEQAEIDARWENLARSSAATEAALEGLRPFIERLTAANEKHADAALQVHQALTELGKLAADTHRLTTSLTRKRRKDRRGRA